MNNFLFRGIVLFVCLSLGEAVLGVAIFLFRSSVKAYRALSYISIAITPVVIYILVGICLVFACGVWHSETTEREHFGRIDTRLSEVVEIGDETIPDILDFDSDDVLYYSYNYQSGIAIYSFNISVHLQLDNTEYAALIAKYSADSDFELSPSSEITTSTGEVVKVDGIFTVKPSSGNVDRWHKMYIAFNEENSRVYICLHGDCYS